MRKLLMSLCIFVLFALPGCSGEMAAGGIGLGTGLGLSNTIQGMQADLEARETALIEKYNALIAAGAKADELADVERDLKNIELSKQTVTVADQGTKVDWSDPVQVGGYVGTLGSLAYAWINRKKFLNNAAALKQIRAESKETEKAGIDKIILSAKAVT